MNRQQRRAQKKIKKPSYRGLTVEQKKEQLFRNGITIEDLEKEYKSGFQDGFSKASPFTVKTCYAAAALALHELHGFGRERVRKVLERMDNHVVDTLVSEEILDEVWQKIGLRMDFNDPLDPIKDAD